MRRTLIMCVLGLAMTGCLGDGAVVPIKEPGLEPRDPDPGKVVVWERGPRALQCESPSVTLMQSAKKLIDAGIAVSRSNCAVDGFAHPAVCGALSGEILVHDVPVSSLTAAMALGFRPESELAPSTWHRTPCSPVMHAIEAAQDTPHCADIRNRVLSIQNMLMPQEQYTLLDQAGSCADASYRLLLYGQEGDQVLCSVADTIAGPQKSCPVESYAQMFDTIIANLDRPDLGLGSAWVVGQIYPVD
ncbi:MAG: hypothetical protein DIU62_001690 [Pseudomonadota bacterium]|jgi:hypothetical protein